MNLKTKLFTLATILTVCSISELNAAPAVKQNQEAKLSVNDHESHMPLFSDENNEHWYFISYANGGRVFTDNGEGKAMTHTTVKAGDETQMWKLVGSADKFKLISKKGNYVYKDGAFRTTASKDKAIDLKLEEAGNPDFTHSFIINYTADGWGIMNPYGDGTVNGWWNDPEDQNNALDFIDPSLVTARPDLSDIKEYAINPSANYTPSNKSTLWYTNPAGANNVSNPWMEYALPIGNGEFGAMIYGGVHCDQIQFNDKSLWTGTSKRRGSYQNFGDIFIEDISDNFSQNQVQDYVRYLDMKEATAGVNYSNIKTAYTRKYIASNPDKVIAILLEASTPGALSIRTRLLSNVRIGFSATDYAGNTASFCGDLDLVSFKASMKVIPTGGSIVTNNDNIEIHNADKILILLSGATNFDQHSPTYISDAKQMMQMVDDRIASAESKGWDNVYAEHLQDFGQFFNRVEFSIEGSTNNATTESLVNSYSKASPTAPESLMLEELYFDFGRYLLICSSRGMDTPANLQGIWNNSDNPAWQSDIHSNINVQMNYWLAENNNLSELHLPYLNYIHSMALDHEEWQNYARKSGQSKGWTCFTQNNIFGHSDYAENYVIANAWYTSHLWQHYLYTLDREFLLNKALPVMINCCEFWLDRLMEAKDGTYVAPKEWSPEHGPAEEDGTAHAQQILYHLFDSTMKAIDILGSDANIDPGFLSQLESKFNKLDKGLAVEEYTGYWGSNCNGISKGTPILREWKYSSFTAGQNGHRHQSHLMAMYPFSNINPDNEFFTPAVNSLKLRSDASTGWSLAWRVCLWARALDGEHAHSIIRNALRHSTSYEIKEDKGGIYYNLLDSHAPFQIDGNFGYCAGVGELMLQSYSGTIRLLPALPSAWKSGHINGLKAEGNFEIDQNWRNGILTEARIKSNTGSICKLSYSNISESTLTDSDGEPVTFTKESESTIYFATESGKSYNLTLPENSAVATINDSELNVTITNGIIHTNTQNASISIYDLTGNRLCFSNQNNLDISYLHGNPVIIKVTSPNNTKIIKHII